MIVPAQMERDLLRLAENKRPSEAVALVGFGQETFEPQAFIPLPNRSPNPSHTFFVFPHEQYKADCALRARGCYVGAIFHSHPNSAPSPSLTDLEMFPDGTYMLIAGRSAISNHWELRAWDGSRAVPIKLPDAAPNDPFLRTA